MIIIKSQTINSTHTIKKYFVLKIFLGFLFLTCSMALCAQQTTLSDYEKITIKMEQLNEAFISKDTSALALILHQNLSLGHSNGWLETKKDLLETLINQNVIYLSIKNVTPFTIHYQSKNLITTRRDIDVKGIYNSSEFDVKLNVLEVWIQENNNWQLLARQSVNRME